MCSDLPTLLYYSYNFLQMQGIHLIMQVVKMQLYLFFVL